MNKNILLCGVGGQGTVLASRLIAEAAMAKGLKVRSAETIGMAQKGGSVFSHLRIGDDTFSPMLSLKSADIIMGFEPAEAVRMLPYLKENGTVVVSSTPVVPVTTALSDVHYTGLEMSEYLKENVKNLIVVNGEEACAEIGSPKVLNMVLLGAAAKSGALGLSIAEITEAMKLRVKPQFIDMNYRALDYLSEKTCEEL